MEYLERSQPGIGNSVACFLALVFLNACFGCCVEYCCRFPRSFNTARKLQIGSSDGVLVGSSDGVRVTV